MTNRKKKNKKQKQRHGSRIPGDISFPPGYVVDFFQIIKDRIGALFDVGRWDSIFDVGMDLLPLIGGICYENPEEEYEINYRLFPFLSFFISSEIVPTLWWFHLEWCFSFFRYLAAGALSIGDVEKAATEIKALLISKDAMMAYEAGAAKKNLDGRWAVQALKDFLRLLLKGCDHSPKPSLLIGVFEWGGRGCVVGGEGDELMISFV